MSVSPVSSGSNVVAQPGTFRKDLQSLSQALQSGDLAGAQQAFETFKSDYKATHQVNSQGHYRVPKQVRQDLSAVGQALQAGDLAGAQQAFATFKSDMKAHQQAVQPQVQAETSASNGTLNVTA